MRVLEAINRRDLDAAATCWQTSHSDAEYDPIPRASRARERSTAVTRRSGESSRTSVRRAALDGRSSTPRRSADSGDASCVMRQPAVATDRSGSSTRQRPLWSFARCATGSSAGRRFYQSEARGPRSRRACGSRRCRRRTWRSCRRGDRGLQPARPRCRSSRLPTPTSSTSRASGALEGGRLFRGHDGVATLVGEHARAFAADFEYRGRGRTMTSAT